MDDSNPGYVPQTYQVLDPFAMVGQFAEKLPRLELPGIGAKFFQFEDRTYLLYQSGDDYRLRDVFARTDRVVLEWLRDAPASFLDKGVSLLADGRMLIQVRQPYGLDVSSTLTLGEVLASDSYTQTMRPIFLPQSILPVNGIRWSEHPSGMMLTSAADRFYWLDYEQGIIRDYCYSEGRFRGTSLDGRFAAFVGETLPHTQPIPKFTVLLNLENGYASKLDGYEFLVWASAGN